MKEQYDKDPRTHVLRARVTEELYKRVVRAAKENKRNISREIVARLEQALDLSLIHISEPTRRSYISYAVFCLKKLPWVA